MSKNSFLYKSKSKIAGIEIKSGDVILKSQNSDKNDVIVDDELLIKEIKPYNTDKVLISNLKTNILKIGNDNNYINLIKYYNNCIQILGADSDSNKIVIGYNIENDEQKNFINTITLSTKSGDIQCNKLITNEIQCNNLHEHENKNLLDSITSNHLHTHHNLNT